VVRKVPVLKCQPIDLSEQFRKKLAKVGGQQQDNYFRQKQQ
jgi:hypothetical protein